MFVWKRVAGVECCVIGPQPSATMKQQPLPRGLYLLFALSVILLLANILTPRCCPPKDASRDLPTAFSPALLAVTSGAIKPCAALDASGSFNRIVFATVPRTGSTFTRYAIEKVTGIGTESFYDETTDGNRSNRTGVYGKPCGALMDCEKVHRGVGSDPVAIKSHFPFIVGCSIDRVD